MNDPLICEQHGRVRVLVNNNPKARNALSPAFYQSLHQALADAARDPGVGALVLTGADGYFCSGGDLRQLATRRDLSEPERRERIELLHGVIRALRDCPVPVIAAIEGGAAGAGVSLALACDMVVMANNAYLSVAYVKVGLSPDGGATAFLSQCMPRQLLAQLVLTGDRITAQRLHALGLVNELVEPGQAQAQAIALAGRLAQGPSSAMARIKALSHSAYHATLDQQLDHEARLMAVSLGDAEAIEGITAFLEKRAPEYHRGSRENT
jgi:enoyl-CoA hydratase/carnithine racemase